MKSKTSLLFADLEVFEEQGEIGSGIYGKTIEVIQTDTQDKYAKKLLTNVEGSINNDKLFSVCDSLSKSQYPFYLPPSYITCANDDEQDSYAAIFTNYMTNKSLHYIIEQQISETPIDEYDSTQEYLILYGISCFLESFHSNKKVHGDVKLTNVLLDEKFSPYVSDSCLYEIIPKHQHSKITNKTIDYIVSLSPEMFNNQAPTRESDIYSFGILILQVLNHQINVFPDYSEVDKIERLIKDNTKPKIPNEIPTQLSEVLDSCFSSDPKKRPTASEIKKVFESILNEPAYIKRFTEFKENSLLPKEEEEETVNQEIINLKRKAEVGNLESMFTYGKRLYEDQKTKEGMNFLRFAAKNGYIPARNFYNNVRKDSSQNLNKASKDDNNNQNGKKTFTSLKDDPIFEQKIFDIKKIIQDVNNNIDIEDAFNYTQEDLFHNDFILTKGAIKRLVKLKKYIDAGIPVILEGPTGTSKTLSTEIICELTDRELIRFNLSSETKSTDLLGRYVGEADSWAGIKMLPGPFITAFEFGKTLLLDEINLGSTECLQFIESILDSGVISVELPGVPLREIKMHPEFRLIATQNPNKDLFIHKRQDLSTKFKSRFQVINFPEFKDELFDIAVGLAKKYNYQDEEWEQIIKDLVSFHMKWSSLEEVKKDIQCITVREIAACVKAFSEHQNIYDTIMTIYGARYQKDMKNKLEDEFRKFSSFKNCRPGVFSYPKDFPKCFQNESLSDALKSILFSFKNHRHVILTGSEGSGLTQIARWISHWYQQMNNNQQDKSTNKEYFCICTNETKCSDLIGKFKPSENLNAKDNNNELIKWKNGSLTEAVINGFLIVLDNLDEAPATVLERLNGLLDQKFEDNNDEKESEDDNDNDNDNNNENSKSKFVFEIPENPKQRKVPIHKNFRLLCICNIDNLNQLSPAFINRFDVVVLEDQIQDNEKDLKSLISMLMKQEKPTNFSPEQRVVDYVYQKVHENQTQTQNSDTKLTMFRLSQLCRAVTKYTDFFDQKIDMKSVVDFSVNMLNKNKDFDLPSNIEEYLLSKLEKQEDSNDNKFFYLDSPNLKSLIAKIFAASLINLPVCLQGPTGVGKTSAAREFARIRPTQNKANEPFLMHTYHAGTKPKDFYGITTISNEQVLFIDGTLTTTMVNGQTFIADEMNLSSIPTMKSLAPALEPINDQFLYIAGVEEPIKVNKEFFFIACQNELGTNGRNAIPRSIASRFRYFYYPEQGINDISPICIQIAKSFYKKGEIPSFSEEESAKVGKYMLELNKLRQTIIPQWSLRDITKLFLRIHYQEANKDAFQNISLYKNILFYTLSPVNSEDAKFVFDNVIKLIAETFSLQNDQIKELKECYNSIPKIDNHYLVKGNSRILIKSFKNAEMLRKLPSLLNSMFQILLSDVTEPILLMGPSGFKTFLAQQFLDDAKIVTLNQESTIAQLLGSSSFLSKEEAKNFYIENICKICHIDQISEYIKQYKEKALTKEKFQEDIQSILPTLPLSLKYSVTHLLDKLFDDNKSSSNNCVLSYLELEFRPGLFLSAILECKSLILKNLSNLPTIILERFNELFSGKHNLTLNEDIHNTFTSKTEKELSDISSNFRVFATCPPNSVNKLSEAVLSRFTVICIPAYKLNEQEKVLQSYIKLNNLSFNDFLISILIKFAEKMELNLNKSFSFPQMINSVEMCSRLNINTKPDKWIENLGIILYRLGYGLLENRNKTKSAFLKIFEETDDNLNKNLPENLKSSIKENPLCLSKSSDGYLGIQSKISNIFFKSPKVEENNKKIAFTPMFSEMLDALHLGISINIPVIFEGMPGQGKQTAIDYISNMLGYQIINVIISQSTKVEDLFGKITITRDKKNNIIIKPIDTKLVKVLEPNSESNNNSIIVFHNINNASSAVLEVLVSIFDQHQKDFLLPNGSTITKGQVKIVGIFNPQNGMFNRDKLPSSLIYSSIYHIVNNPKYSEILSVIGTQFEDTSFRFEIQSFYHNFIITKGISDEANASPLTLSDIEKYRKFREVTYDIFDKDIISLMLLAYRFIHHKTISDAISKIDVSDMIFKPIFSFHPEKKKLIISVKEKSDKNISLDCDASGDDINSIKSELASLTLPEKRCILFLAFAVLSKQACLIKGETASGKSHIIRLFAKMLGKKLNVYQMNSETSVSILTGQSVLSNHLSKEDVDDINSALTELERIPEISDYIAENITNIQPDEWTRGIFSKLLEYLSSFDFSKYPENEEFIESSKQKIIETIQPAKRFHVEESSFIRALTEGEWVLFDGIESAPSEIIEKISPLCGENPQLNLLECGEGYYFTSDYLKDSKKINKNFHLFFTYNPTSQVENKILDPDFVDNCASFTLPSIDSTPENTAQRILGTMIQNYPEKISAEISKRYAMTHSFAKEESKNDSDSFAGDLQLTGRTVNFVSKEFTHHAKVCKNSVEQIFRPICYSMKYYYLNSYINKNKEKNFKEQMIKEFSKDIDPKQFSNLTYEGINLKDKYKEILIDLRNIQIYESDETKPYSFKFSDFVQKCFQLIQINDIDFILDHINDTINIIDNSEMNFTREFSQLKIISNIFEEIKNERNNLSDENSSRNLNDENLLKTKQLEKHLSKLKLLSKLSLNDAKCFALNIPHILYDSNFVAILKHINIMLKKDNLDNFRDFIFLLNSYPNFIPLIETYFPYDRFEQTKLKMIHYILPMIRILHESNSTFNIFVSNEKIAFKYDKLALFEPTYIIEFDTELTISSSSQIAFTFNTKCDFKNKIPIDQFTDDESVNSFYYNLTKYFVDDNKHIGNFITSKRTSNFINKSNPRGNQISRLSRLLSNENLPSLVACIWPMIFSFPKDLITTFSNFLLPLEKDLLLAFDEMFEIIDKNNIEQFYNFSICMIDFGKEKSFIWQVVNNKFHIDPNINYDKAKDIRDSLENEIQYLKSIPKLTLPNKTWPIHNYINQLKKQKDKINDTIDILMQKNEKLKLMKKLNPILEQLEKISSEKYKSLKNQIYNEIKNDSNLSEEKIKFYDIQVNKFIDSIKQEDNDYAKNAICWPTYKLTNEISQFKSPTMELYQIMIWYSTIISIFNKINDSNDQNVFEYILELNKFEEVKDIAKFLTNRFLHIENSNKKELDSNEISLINGILNANFISKLIDKNLIDQINKLCSILNKLSDRNAIKDENILFWIHKIANQYPPDFCISLPKFKPKDLIYLFVGYNEYDADDATGPILKNKYNDYRNFMKDIKKLLTNNFGNSSQCSILIAQSIYKNLTKETNTPPDDFQGLMKFLSNYNKAKQNYYIKIALKVMEVAEKIDSQKTESLKFNDVFFFDEKWIKNDEYVNKYPSLVFWLCKNHLCMDKLRNIFGNQQFSKDELPFWLFVLRLMSSESCIVFDSSSTTKTGKELTKIINEGIRKAIRNRIDNSEPVGTKWLNIILPSLPQEIANQKYQSFYHMFYQFFLNLSEDEKSLQKETFEVKIEQLRKFVKKVCSFVFKDDPEAIFNHPIDTKDDVILSLIRDPNEFIGNKVQNKMNDVTYEFLNSQKMKNLALFTSKLKDNVNNHIKTLQDLIEKEDDEKEKKFNDDRAKFRKKELETMKKNILKCIKSYKKLFDELISHEPIKNLKQFQKNCNSLIQSLDNLPQCFDKTAEPLELCKFERKSKYSYPYYICSIRLHKNDSIDIKEKTPYYFYKEHYKDLDDKLKKDMSDWSLLKLYPINSYFDIEKYCSKNYKESKVFTKPTLSFGNSYSYYGLNSGQFISKITHTSDDAINFVNNLYSELKTTHINDNTFRAPDELMNEIKSLTYYFNAQYSDKSKCDNINSFLTKMKGIFTQLNSYISSISSDLKYEVEAMWRASYQSFKLKPVFDDVYKLPIPKFYSINNTKQVFKNIKSTNFISNPILSVNNGSIICYPTSLKCTLGPFIPSLYSQKFAINFISFIDESFTIKIKTDQNHKNMFSSESFSKGGLAQIKFSLPEVSSEKQEKHEISSEIIFESENYKKLTLPCNLTIQVVPLSFLISCNQSQLSFKNNMFYVCKDRLLPLSLLTFSISNFYLNELTNMKYQLISLDGNTIGKPIINRYGNTLELKVPDAYNVKRLHAELKLKFSDNFSTSILIDAIVIPFDFEFEVYDPNEKIFNKNATIYYTPRYLDRDIKLHFRILCPTLNDELKCEIKDGFPFEIQAKIQKVFFIKSNTEFDVTLRISQPLKSKNSYYYYSYSKQQQDPSYDISININGKYKTVSLKFSQLNEQIVDNNRINTKFLINFNGYAYKDSDKQWYRVNKNGDTIGYSCFISPFSFYKQNDVKIFYFMGCKVEAKESSFIYINEDGEIYQKETNKAIIEKKDGIFVRALKRLANKNSDLYPIYGVSGNNWFPVFDTYKPDLTWNELDIDNNNIEIAKQRIKKIDDTYSRIFNPTHFYNLIRLLKYGKVIKHIKDFIQHLPINIRSSFDDIIVKAETLNSDNPLMIILSHNAILLFKQHFENRYKEIVKNQNCASFCSLNQNEIDQQIKKCFEEYSQINSRSIMLTSHNYQKYKNIDIEVSDIQLEQKPEEKSYTFQYTEKSLPIPKPLNFKPQYVSSNNSEITYPPNSNIKFELPNLSIQDDDDDDSITIQKLNSIYLSAINGARLLPIFVSNMKSQKSAKMEQKANDYFYHLLHLYKNLPVRDFSFISKTTNLFSESFTSMIGKFKKAGVDFGSILPSKCKILDENIQDFYQYPEKDEFTIPADQWNTDDFVPKPSPNPTPLPTIKVREEDPDKKEESSDDDDDDDYPTKKNKPSAVNEEEQKSKEKKNISFKNIISKMQQEIENEEEEENDIDKVVVTDDEDDDTPGPSSNVCVTSNNDIENQKISLEELDGMLSKFTDENGIIRAISRMKDYKEREIKPPLNLIKPDPLNISSDFFDTKKENFPISELIPHSFYLANKFIKEAFDMEIKRSKFAVNILIDCSSFISQENKIFNMMIICALTTALESLEIPYSAAVIADKDFKCVVKSFNEPHSPKCLQKILDCLLIKRYRTKLASSINYAIKTMSFNDDKNVENKRPYRAIFTFSDGLDEQLVLTDAWSKYILAGKDTSEENDKSDNKDNLAGEILSFGFIFIESTKLKDDDKAFIEKVWKDLEKEINKNKIIPILKIAPIKAEISDKDTDMLVRLFNTVMKRAITTEEKLSEKLNSAEAKQEMNSYSDAYFSIDEKLSNIKRFSTFIRSDYSEINGIYTTSTHVLKNASSKIDKLNPLKYRNKLKKIAKCEIDSSLSKEECYNFIKRFIISKRKINQASLEAVLKPNKASQTVLSTTGTDFDITALVLNLINPVPDPMIYLEEKGGLIRNYGISIVVDPSISCFDELSGPHSIQTLQTILSSLLTLDISCFDLIVAGNPHPKVICSEVGTIHALSNKSSLYSSLFAVLQNPIHNTDLSSAIHMAFDLRRMRSSDHTSILFVLTNGLYDNKECEKIVNSVNVCVQSGITTFGIGIGNYPKGIEKLFPQAAFSRNPANIMKAIASFYGDSIPLLLPEMTPINFVPPKLSDLISTIKNLIDNEDKPIFNSLKDALKSIVPTLDAFSDIHNEEQNIGDALNGYINPVGVNTEMYIKDCLKTQKILIVMLWDYTLNDKQEEHYIHPDYINKPSEEGAGCIKTAVEHFGITLTIVRNYEDAINELTKQSKEGFCDYYATWVFCGPPYEILPEKNADPNLVGQFNEVLIQFWKNGGSIVFWAEGDPLHYQVNLFLETVKFENEKECPSGKVSFRIGGEHTGTNILTGEESDKLERKRTFNRMKRKNNKFQRSILSHNIGKIYEGITISYAPYDLKAIKPFKPFSRDSEGGISSLFYEANYKTGTGDIIIDCGYTKCFTKMSTDGTFRYVQNIAGWTARPEFHFVIDKVEPSEWKPKAVNFKIQRGVIWNKFQILAVDPKKQKTLWAIDASFSIKNNPHFHDELKKVVEEYHKKDDEFYLWSDKIENISYNQLQTFMNNRDGRSAGTKSSLIAEIANKSDIRDHLLIVTDGSVDMGEIDKSDQKMRDYHIRFKCVTTFIIQDEFDPTTRENLNDPNTRSQISQQVLEELRLKPDLSVGAPYSRRCQNITYYIKGNGAPRIEMASLKSEDINALNNIDNINNYNEFIKEYDKLDHAIQASTLGQTENSKLVKQLEDLKKRVKNSGLDSQQNKDFDDKFEVLYRMANGGLRNAFKLEDIAAAKQGTVK